MADQKLSELTLATGAVSSDLLYVVQGATSKKIAFSSVLSSISALMNISAYATKTFVTGELTSYTTNANLTSTLNSYTTNANLTSTLASVSQHIIPAANVTYDLGSPTRAWRSLYVSGTTIYLGGTALSLSSGSLVVGSSTVITNQNANATIPVATTSALGLVRPDGTSITITNGVISSAGGGAGTGNFTFSSNTMTVPTNGIIRTPDDKTFQLQAKDIDSLLRNEIKLDPNNGTYMSVWSGELSTSFNTSDWATASWENLEGVPGVSGAYFTNAENLQDFWTIGAGSFVNSVEVSINGGARLPVSYDGNNGETYGALLLVVGVPATSPTTITSLTFYYRTKNRIDIDYSEGEILLDAQSMDIDIRTTNNLDLRSNQNLNLRSLGQYPVRIYTNNNSHIWEFDSTGSLTLPSEGKLYGIGLGPGGDRLGYISWDGNSSGDGFGYNTMRLVPDLQGLEDADQYIILDPTSPGHIHIRAGGTQDNSQAHLFLGGENSHVKISAGPNPPVSIASSSNVWTFGTDGTANWPSPGYVPATSTSTGTRGQVTWDSGYVYICVATNTWKRATLNSW